MIASLYCLCSLWLVRVITLTVLVLRRSAENRSIVQPIRAKLNLLLSCLERLFPFLYFSVSNTFKVEKFHGLILLKHHNPLEVNEVMVRSSCFARKLHHTSWEVIIYVHRVLLHYHKVHLTSLRTLIYVIIYTILCMHFVIITWNFNYLKPNTIFFY